MPPALRLSPEDERLVGKVARLIVRRRLAAPALMLLESGRPFNFVASQFLAFCGPFATLLLDRAEYDRFVALLEHREALDVLVEAISAEADRSSARAAPGTQAARR